MSTEVKIPKVRVCVPYPNNGGIMTECETSLSKLSKCKDIETEILEVQGASISLLRSNGVNKGISERCHQKNFDFDYYMCIDSDIEFSVEDVKKLISMDVDIASGAYQYRNNKDRAVAGMFEGVIGRISKDDFIPWTATGIKEVDWVGAGFLLIKKEVFEKTKYPWFREHIIEYESGGVMHANWIGEDVGFCIAVKEAGFKIYCDMDVKVNHLVYKPFEKPIPMEEKKVYSNEDAFKMFLELVGKLRGCGEMFYNGLKNYEEFIKIKMSGKED
jgi:hypothetical protein